MCTPERTWQCAIAVWLQEAADTVIVVPNQRLLDHVAAGKSVEEAFALADDVVRQGVQVRVLVATLSTVGSCRNCSARLISVASSS